MKPQRNANSPEITNAKPLIDLVDPNLLPFLAAVAVLLSVCAALIYTYGFAALITIALTEVAVMFGILLALTRGKQ